MSTASVRTSCPYCGVGCGLIAEARDGRLESVRGDVGHPVNSGRTCAKPLALPKASRSRDRALWPLARETREHRWRRQGWDETIATLARRLLAIREEHGPEAIAFYVSGQLLTEDYYAVNKLAKGLLGTNNVDSNSRLCMSSAVAGYTETFGSDGPPPAYADISRCHCFLLLGTNTAACHPIIWGRIRQRQEMGATVIAADPRRTPTAEGADLHLPLRPGTDLALLNAMMAVIESEGLVDERFVERHTEGFEEMMAVAREWTPARSAEVCGVPAEDIVLAARRFASSPASMALWSMGANQSTVGTLKNRALNSLCLITGQIGREGAGPLSLTGQPNAMGGRETGGLAHLLPGYRKVASAADRAEIEAIWDLPRGSISAQPGLPATDLFDALEEGGVKAVWIVATNPAVSLPDAERARAALRKAELVICQDAYHPTETSALADLVLPAAQWPEKEGTMTNSERRVGLVRKLIEPPGEALPDWEIFARLGRAMGFGEQMPWTSPAEVYDEFAQTTAGRLCDVSGLSHERLRNQGTIQWPCPAEEIGEHRGTERLYANHRYATPSGRARLAPLPHSAPAETADPDFPLVLTTGRVSNQWHTMTRTGKSRELLSADPKPFIELNPADAQAVRIRDGSRARVSSRRGSVVLTARVTDAIRPGTAFAPFHWGALHAPRGAGQLNGVTNGATDPISRQPELKACAIKVEPIRGRRGPGRDSHEGTPESSAGGRTDGPRMGVPSRSPARRLVVVGTGMAGLATVEAALECNPERQLQITMVGREPEQPYDRIKLTRALSRGAAGLELKPASWYAERGVDLVTGTEATALDTSARALTLGDGRTLAYDRLVLATGSAPAMPPIEGLDRDGVFAFRTIADTRAIAERAQDARRAVVIGGGLLGLEAARGLAELGLEVRVIHLVDHLMETQLDPAAARLLERRLRTLGVETLLEREALQITGNGRAGGLRLDDDEELDADLVVVATGIVPETSLAKKAGLEVGRGILVDDEMRTSAPSVWAVGECAEHRGAVYGVWAPLLEQARVAGSSIAGEPAAYHGSTPATTLKVSGIDLFVSGVPSATVDGDDEIVAADTRSDVYRKLIVREGRLVGAILLGDTSLSPEVTRLIRDDEPLGEDLIAALLGAGESSPPIVADGPVCTCMDVSAEQILTAIRGGGLGTVEEVSAATKACTGCGSCAPTVRALLSQVEAERVEEMHHARLSTPGARR